MTSTRTSDHDAGGGLCACWISDLGCMRDNNEDACFVSCEEGLFLISDGMGGEHAGELASSLVIEWLPELVSHHVELGSKEEGGDVPAALRDAMLELNHRLRHESSQLGGGNKMGATVAMVLVRQENTYVAHMGDSRVYLLHSGVLEPLTEDHSVVAILVNRGAINPEDARSHPMRGQLSRYVGMGGEARADVETVPFYEGDRLLLCTDGLTDCVSDADIERMLVESEDLHHACAALVDAAKGSGGRDNISALVIEREPA